MKDVMTGGNTGTIVVNCVALMSVPPVAVTVMKPVPAPSGTVTVTWLAVALMMADDTPLIKTELTPSGKTPVMTTLLPARPEAGEKLVIAGGVRKESAVSFVPAGVISRIGPLEAAAGAGAVI